MLLTATVGLVPIQPSLSTTSITLAMSTLLGKLTHRKEARVLIIFASQPSILILANLKQLTCPVPKVMLAKLTILGGMKAIVRL